MLNHFTFNGHSTGELGLLVSGINIYGSPSRVVEKVNIPYRSGDLLIDTGAYTNYMLTYTVDIMDNTKATAEAISKWLLGSKGYCELTDTYNPEIYRVASYYNQLDYTLSALYRYGKATITFDCKPQKYLTANQPVSLSSTLSEETSYSLSTPAMPLPLTLEGNTTQGENPTPEAPQEIHSVKGDNEIRVVRKNIIPITATTQTMNGVTFTVNEDGTVRANGTATTSFSFNFFYRGSGASNGIPLTAGKTYVLSTADMQYFPINIQIMRNGQPIAVSSNSPFTAQEGDYVSIVWVWRQSGTVFNNALFSPQFEVGSTPTAFEPYKAQVYPINLPVENLTNASDIIAPPNVNSSNTRIGGDYSLTAGTYTLSWTISNTVTGTRNRPLYTDGGSSVYCPTDSYTKGRHSWTFTLDTDTNIVMYWWYHTLSAECTISEFMLEKGTSTTYFPYGTTSIELNALGTYKDYFYKSDGKWYLHKAIDKVDMGTLTWARRATNIFGSNLTNGTDVTADISAHMSNYFPIQYVTGVVNTQINTIAIYKTSNITSTTNIYISLANIDTVEDLTTWFNSHATELYYPLATPTNTEITNSTLISQLNAISKAKTYDGSTTIVQEGTDAQFKLSMPVPTEISSEYFGEPIITVNEVGTIVWNDSLIKVNSAPVTINSQALQCYYYSENKNNNVEINEFPKYEQGENYIGSTMTLTVVPNYWKL